MSKKVIISILAAALLIAGGIFFSMNPNLFQGYIAINTEDADVEAFIEEFQTNMTAIKEASPRVLQKMDAHIESLDTQRANTILEDIKNYRDQIESLVSGNFSDPPAATATNQSAIALTYFNQAEESIPALEDQIRIKHRNQEYNLLDNSARTVELTLERITSFLNEEVPEPSAKSLKDVSVRAEIPSNDRVATEPQEIPQTFDELLAEKEATYQNLEQLMAIQRRNIEKGNQSTDKATVLAADTELKRLQREANNLIKEIITMIDAEVQRLSTQLQGYQTELRVATLNGDPAIIAAINARIDYNETKIAELETKIDYYNSLSN